MRIAQISDFHFTRLSWNPFRLFSKRLLGHFNWLFSRTHTFSEAIVFDLPPLLEELGVTHIVLGGDFTTTALHEEFAVAKTFIEKLPAPYLALPGNHDVYTYRSQRKKTFYRMLPYQTLGSDPLVDCSLAEDKVGAYRLDNGYWLVAIDVCRATNFYSSRGLFSEQLEKKLIDVLALIPPKDFIILCCHYPFFQNDAHRRTLKRGDILQKILQQDSRIRLFLHGHTHRNTIADLQIHSLPILLDSGSCAQKDRASWNLIDVTDKGCKVTAYHYKDGWQPRITKDMEWTRR